MPETHWKKLTNPDYLGSWDFAKGEERVLTINNVNQQEVFNQSSGKKEMCTVAHFQEKSKPMILNKTNCKMIAKLYDTPFIEKWSGCKILIGVDKVKAKGELVEALRIRNNKPTATTEYTIPACNDCNGEIKPYDKYSASDVANANKKKYDVYLCAECSMKRKIEAEKKVESEENNNESNA